MLTAVNIQTIFYLLISTLIISASDKAVLVRDIRGVVDQWNPDQHLYIKGNVGVSESSLNSLENWLDAHGKNWTVVLSQSMKGEDYRSPDQRSFSGVTAAEYILSRGLGNLAEFVEQQNNTSGEANGVIFMISLKERSFSYFAEEVYELRGLGHTDWAGQLDHPARRAMQRGQLVQSVRNTVGHIDEKLNQVFAEEARAEQQAVKRKQGLVEQVERDLVKFRVDLKEAKQEATNFHKKSNHLRGDIGVISDTKLESKAANVRSTLESKGKKDIELTAAAMTSVKAQLKRERELMKLWENDRERVENLIFEAESFELDDDSADVAGAFEQLVGLAISTREVHQKGESAYITKLNEFDDKLDYLYSLNDGALIAREKKEALAVIQKQADEKRQKTQKTAAAVGGGLALIGGVTAAAVSRRRRKKPKQKAEELLEERKAWLSDRTDELFALQDRAELVVGSTEELEAREYKGLTRSVSEKVIRSVDHAYILTAGVDRLIQRASSLVSPASMAAKLSNGFSRARFDQAIEILQDEPVTMLKNDEVALANKDKSALLGEGEEEFSMNFSELRSDFRSSVTIAVEGLDRVEGAWEVIAETMRVLEENSLELNQRHDALHVLGAGDGFFQMLSFDNRWMSRLSLDLTEAHLVAQNDPVKVIEELLPSLDDVHHEMGLILQGVEHMREEGMSYVLAFQRKLNSVNRENDWIEEELEDLSESLDLIAQQGASSSVLSLIDSWCQESEAFAKSCKRGSETLKELEDLRLDISNELEPEVRRVRTQLSRVTNVPEDLVLREDGGPEGQIIHAKDGLNQLEESLDEGRVDLADEELFQALSEVEAARVMLEQTLQAQEDYIPRLEHYEGLLVEVDEKLPAHIEIDDFLRQRYFDKVLGESVVNAIDQVKEFLSSMAELSNAVKVSYSQGELLKSKYLLDVGEESAAAVQSRYALLEATKVALNKLEHENTSNYQGLRKKGDEIKPTMDDPKVSVGTQRSFSELESVLAQADQGMNDEFGLMNPDIVATQLEQCSDIYQRLVHDVDRDRDAHSKYTQLQELMTRELTDLKHLMKVAANDGVVDSEEIELCSRNAEKIRNEDARLREEGQDHADWVCLRERADQLLDEAEETKSKLKNEIRTARESLKALRAAEDSLSTAMHWKFSYGVRANCGAASNALQEAHNLLSRGQYSEALRSAGLAASKARSALSFAQSQEASIRRKRAAARRRRSPGFSVGAGSFSSSSFSGGSSFRGGGSSSGGSGFGRSGW